MNDQTIPEEAINAASRAHARALCDPRTGFRDCVAAGLAAAYPHLRQQWEAEIATEIRAVKERHVDAYLQMRIHHCEGDVDGEQLVTWDEAAAHKWDVLYPALSDMLARGAAQPGGTE